MGSFNTRGDSLSGGQPAHPSGRGLPQPRPARGADLAAVQRLLQSSGLPIEGVREGLKHFLVCRDAEGALLGTVGLEHYGGVALLRSTVVAEPVRRRGVAAALVERAMGRAREQGCRTLYLLTLDADDYFQRFGFAAIDREEAPAEIQASPEFTTLCPDSAVLMRKRLDE